MTARFALPHQLGGFLFYRSTKRQNRNSGLETQVVSKITEEKIIYLFIVYLYVTAEADNDEIPTGEEWYISRPISYQLMSCDRHRDTRGRAHNGHAR